MDIAKRLLDHEVHPPTVYFPLLVEEALMIEPTETEPKERLDHFAEAIRSILEEAKDDPEVARNAPYSRRSAAWTRWAPRSARWSGSRSRGGSGSRPAGRGCCPRA